MKPLKLIHGQASTDGDGVALTRYIGTHELLQQDPFLLFDVFGSPNQQNHHDAFPPHPHRGFETLTYMIAGSMTHEDNQGHQDTVNAGGIQWMRAGAGIIHAETPQADDGRLWGTQLWINSPAKKKMTNPQYLAQSKEKIPVINISEGVVLHLLAGRYDQTVGPLINEDIDLHYAHLKISTGNELNWHVNKGHQGFVYVISGSIGVNDLNLAAGQMLSFKATGSLHLDAKSGSELLIVSGQPINEPIARRGPFVMNTQQELEQAFRDYRNGRF